MFYRRSKGSITAQMHETAQRQIYVIDACARGIYTLGIEQLKRAPGIQLMSYVFRGSRSYYPRSS